MNLNKFFEKMVETSFYCYEDKNKEEIVDLFKTVAKQLLEENEKIYPLADVYTSLLGLLEKVDEEDLHFLYYTMKLIMVDREKS